MEKYYKATYIENIDKDPNKNPDEELFKIIKNNMKAGNRIMLSEYLLYPSELRKHFIEMSIGNTVVNWVFDLFTPEQKSKHLDIAIDNVNSINNISTHMLGFLSYEQKTKLYEKNVESGKGISNEVLKTLNPEQINAYIKKRVEIYGDGDIEEEIFNLLDLETKLCVITHCGLSNLERTIKNWYYNYQKGLKREEQIKSLIDES
jgi:hypothetical protein